MFCLNSIWISYRELLFSVIIDSFIVMFSMFYTTQTGVSPSVPFSTSCHLREPWTTDVIELGWRQQLLPCTAFVPCTAPSAENLVQHHSLASQSSQFCYPATVSQPHTHFLTIKWPPGYSDCPSRNVGGNLRYAQSFLCFPGHPNLHPTFRNFLYVVFLCPSMSSKLYFCPLQFKSSWFLAKRETLLVRVSTSEGPG